MTHPIDSTKGETECSERIADHRGGGDRAPGVTPGFAQDKVYLNGSDADYPPFSFVGKDGKPAGFDMDALDWIANEIGFKVKHQPTDWAAIVPTLNSRRSTSSPRA